MFVSGDGGSPMPMGDFLTLVQYAPPVEVLPFANSSLGTAGWERPIFGRPPYGTPHRTPDFAAVAPETVAGCERSADKAVLDGGVGLVIRMARSDLRNVSWP
ncbi:hypothetical protein GPJ59_33645 [Streptomyces bambusae]|uniref:Thiamine pyrophosphate enzyme TPP-binding domain-containing protein n=1 Tax=Streptomyces bambusae TaxID=1550616 RepID=A0ABS6ZFX2_9ACTN|nr:hypothetical protein [Streptomyces bambusae]